MSAVSEVKRFHTASEILTVKARLSFGVVVAFCTISRLPQLPSAIAAPTLRGKELRYRVGEFELAHRSIPVM